MKYIPVCGVKEDYLVTPLSSITNSSRGMWQKVVIVSYFEFFGFFVSFFLKFLEVVPSKKSQYWNFLSDFKFWILSLIQNLESVLNIVYMKMQDLHVIFKLDNYHLIFKIIVALEYRISLIKNFFAN